MSGFNTLLRKASSLLRLSNYDSSPKRSLQDGEVMFCKNNVCVHPPMTSRTEMFHHPGYLTIREQTDEVLGSTLILTWIPNATLKKNPKSLENRTPEGSPCRSSLSSKCPSPALISRSPSRISANNSRCTESGKLSEELEDGSPRFYRNNEDQADRRSISSTISDMGSPREDLGSLDSFSVSDATSTGSVMPPVDTAEPSRPEDRRSEEPDGKTVTTGGTQSQSDSGIGPEEVVAALEKMICGLNDIEEVKTDEVAKPQSDKSVEDSDEKEKINNLNKCDAPLPQNDVSKRNGRPDLQLTLPNNLNENMSKDSISCTIAPDISVTPHSNSSSTTPTTSNRDPESFPSTPGETPPLSPKHKFRLVEETAESLAHAHNLSFPGEENSGEVGNVTSRRESSCGVFSVDLSQMRSLRLFYSNKECTSGQLVIASRESQYKILHFHCGGLDKLASIFEDYNFLSKSKCKTNDFPYKQFSVCRPEVSAAECHPEEGVYGTVDDQRWRSFLAEDGSVEDELQLRKEIFFGGLDPKLRREVWPFLLHYYSFQSTFEEREQIRNDRYIEYQNIRRKRDQMSNPIEIDLFWRNIQCTVEKDVVRTDRSHPFFAGEDNPNIEIMKNILLNYGFYNPKIGYTQGMSDLLAPILFATQNESEAFWCFVGLMQHTIFVTCPKDFDMDINLNYLRELFQLMNKKFFDHLMAAEALDLLFVHRWILLCFKREFSEAEAMRMWEACWAHCQTDYFHLFLCSAIVSVYGEDVIAQRLRADEMMVHFSSLALHMDGELVLRKARGLLHQFRLLPRIPCALSRLCELCGTGMWDSGHVPIINCSGDHGDHSCPFGGQDPSIKVL